MDQWLKRGQCLNNNAVVLRWLSIGDNFQIYKATQERAVLVVEPLLMEKWLENGCLSQKNIEDKWLKKSNLFYFMSQPDCKIYSLLEGPYPEDYAELCGFSAAMKLFRSKNSKLSLKDAIYIEENSLLLPTFSQGPDLSDDVVLGTWISGGIPVSVFAFPKIRMLAQWLDKDEIIKAIEYAGLNINDTVSPEDNESASKNLELGKKSKEVSGAENRNVPLSKRFLLPGRTQLEIFFNDQVVEIYHNAEKYAQMGITSPPAILLYGMPGCGKTFAVQKLAEFLDFPYFEINASSVASPYIHDTSKKISEVFAKAIECAPSILVIDEMEAFLSSRDSNAQNHHIEEVDEFLRLIPEANKARVLIVGMTNKLNMIDNAILRRGRFDQIIEVGMPSKIEINAMLNEAYSKLPVSGDVDLDYVAERLINRPLSDAAYIVRESGRIAAKLDKREIDEGCVEGALETLSMSYSSKEEDKRNTIGFK